MNHGKFGLPPTVSCVLESEGGGILTRVASRAGNIVYGNADAGMALMEAFRANVQGNSFEDNTYGIRLSVGCADNVFKGNDIIGSSK